MIDKFLAAGSIFDWITPLWAIFSKAKHSGADYTVPVECLDDVYALGEVIDIWAIQIVGNDVVFIARAEDEAIIDEFLSQ